MKKNDIYKCSKCGNLIEVLWNGERVATCCGDNMRLVNPDSGEFLIGDHTPNIKVKGNTIEVEINHPMESDHYILFIELINKEYCYRVNFVEGDRMARAKFRVDNTDNFYVRTYCNRHGLYSTL